MKKKLLRILVYIFIVVVFGNIIIGIFEEKLMDVKYSYSNVELLNGSINKINDNEYALNILLENNCSEEIVIYDYYINLYTDSKMKDEVYFQSRDYKEVVIPGGSTGNIVLNVVFDNSVEIKELYAEIEYIGEDNKYIELKFVK